MICVVSVFSHLLQDLPHGEDLISGWFSVSKSSLIVSYYLFDVRDKAILKDQGEYFIGGIQHRNTPVVVAVQPILLYSISSSCFMLRKKYTIDMKITTTCLVQIRIHTSVEQNEQKWVCWQNAQHVTIFHPHIRASSCCNLPNMHGKSMRIKYYARTITGLYFILFLFRSDGFAVLLTIRAHINSAHVAL